MSDLANRLANQIDVVAYYRVNGETEEARKARTVLAEILSEAFGPGASTPEPGPISQPPGIPTEKGRGGSSGFEEWWKARQAKRPGWTHRETDARAAWDARDKEVEQAQALIDGLIYAAKVEQEHLDQATRARDAARAEAAGYRTERDTAWGNFRELEEERDRLAAEVAKLREERDWARGFEEDLDVKLTKARNALGRAGVPEVVGAWPGRMLSVAERIEWLDLARPPREDRPPAPPSPADVSKKPGNVATSGEPVDAVNVSPPAAKSNGLFIAKLLDELQDAARVEGRHPCNAESKISAIVPMLRFHWVQAAARLRAAEALAEAADGLLASGPTIYNLERTRRALAAFRSSGGARDV